MAPLDDLYTSLALDQAAKQSIAASDPYTGGIKIADSLGQSIAQSGPDYSLQDKLIYGALSGLFSGGLGELSQDYESRAVNAYQTSILDAAQGKVTAQPSVLSDSLFRTASDKGTLFKKFSDISNQAALNGEKQKIVSDIIGKAAGSGDVSLPAAIKAIQTGDYTNLTDGSVDPSKNPDSKSYKANKDLKDLENTFYNRITGLPQYKLLADIDSNIKALPDLAKRDDRASDVGLISTIARIRDPGSTVKDGEYKLSSDTQSYLDSVYGDWRAVVNGSSKLNPLAKLQMVASVLPKYNQLKSSYDEEKGRQLNALTSQGGAPGHIAVPEFSQFQLAPLAQDLAKQEAAILRAQGVSPADVAQQLRTKYGGYLQ